MNKQSGAVTRSSPAPLSKSRQQQMYSDEDYEALQREMRNQLITLKKEELKHETVIRQSDAMAANNQRLIKELEAKTNELRELRAAELRSSGADKLVPKLQDQVDFEKSRVREADEMRKDAEADNKRLTQKIFQIGAEGKGALAKVADDIKKEQRNRACLMLLGHFDRSALSNLKRNHCIVNWMTSFLRTRLNVHGSKLADEAGKNSELQQKLDLLQGATGADDEQLKHMQRIGTDGTSGSETSAALMLERDDARRDQKNTLQECQTLTTLLKTEKELRKQTESEMLSRATKAEQELAALRERKRVPGAGGSASATSNNAAMQDKIDALSKENLRLKQLLDVEKARVGPVPSPSGPVKVATEIAKRKDVVDLSQFEAGGNVLEVGVMHATLSQVAIEDLGYSPAVLQSFVLVDFASHQPTTTKLAAGLSPRFDLDIEYTVEVDAFFLELLLEEPLIVEFYIRTGAGIVTQDTACNDPFATGTLSLGNLLRHPEQRVLERVDLLTEAKAGVVARCIGSIQLSAGMRQSISAVASRFMQHSSNALNATLHQAVSRTTAASSADPRATIAIHVIGCTGLRMDRSGPPSPCVAYQFFNFPPTDTCVELSTPNPQFNDLRFFEVVNDNHIKNYIRSCELDFTVFDDSGPQPDTIIGSALVRLEPLLRKESLQGQFEIMANDKAVGLISLEISWQYRPTATTSNQIGAN